MAWDSLAIDSISQPINQIYKNARVCPQAIFSFWMDPVIRNYNHVGGAEMTLCGIDTNRYQVIFHMYF